VLSDKMIDQVREKVFCEDVHGLEAILTTQWIVKTVDNRTIGL
jgi:hypothetical protein